MNREFLLNAAFLVLVNGLIKPFYVFGIERTVQERVGPEQYGVGGDKWRFTFEGTEGFDILQGNAERRAEPSTTYDLAGDYLSEFDELGLVYDLIRPSIVGEEDLTHLEEPILDSLDFWKT